MVVVPFPFLSLTAQKPQNSAYPTELKTIGDHIKKKRLDLGLLQKDVAKVVGTTTKTLPNWEKNHVTPAIRFMPKIIKFLGYIPFEIGESLQEKLLAYRKLRGLSRENAAIEIGVYESTLWKWEKGIISPRFRTAKEKVARVIQSY